MCRWIVRSGRSGRRRRGGLGRSWLEPGLLELDRSPRPVPSARRAGALPPDPARARSAAGYDPATDVNSMANTTAYTGATAWWAAGYTGAGRRRRPHRHRASRPSTGLTGAGKVINGPDLSFESQAPNLPNLDTNGHGTFMAGLIAGTTTSSRLRRPGDLPGIAPDARIVSVKVGVADGGTDVSPGHRRDRLGRPAPQRQRPEHPGHQPLVRHQLDPGLPRSTRSPTRPSRPGRQASSSSPPAATTASRAT